MTVPGFFSSGCIIRPECLQVGPYGSWNNFNNHSGSCRWRRVDVKLLFVLWLSCLDAVLKGSKNSCSPIVSGFHEFPSSLGASSERARNLVKVNTKRSPLATSALLSLPVKFSGSSRHVGSVSAFEGNKERRRCSIFPNERNFYPCCCGGFLFYLVYKRR